MPLEKATWGDTFGMCTDQFGISSLVNIRTVTSPGHGELDPASGNRALASSITRSENGLIAVSLGSYDAEEYARLLAEGVKGPLSVSTSSGRGPTRYQVSISPFPLTRIVPRGLQTNSSFSSS
jgi:hypothetical protein